MKVKLVDNLSVRLLEELSPVIAQSKDCRIAVAFVSTGGLDLLASDFQRCLERDGHMEFLVGLDLSTTDPQALWTLYQMSQANPNVSFYCFGRLESGAIYHPKLYIAGSDATTAMIVGSSNLTEGGLKENVEVNVLMEADTGEEIVSDVYSVYNKLKFHPHRVIPDQEFLSLYQEMYSLRRDWEKSSERDTRLKRAKSRFMEKAASLKHPIPTDKDLFGWQKLVFERLPEGPFRTNDLYKFEEELRAHYPANRNIRAKIRQILQQLRDMGLVRHVRTGVWIREGDIRKGSVG
ncbi:MAG: phospholipase D-like domain-containing protein [Anaerolineae bacterium]